MTGLLNLHKNLVAVIKKLLLWSGLTFDPDTYAKCRFRVLRKIFTTATMAIFVFSSLYTFYVHMLQSMKLDYVANMVWFSGGIIQVSAKWISIIRNPKDYLELYKWTKELYTNQPQQSSVAQKVEKNLKWCSTVCSILIK